MCLNYDSSSCTVLYQSRKGWIMDQFVFESTVPLQPCPVCGASPQERSWRSFVSGAYLKVRSEKHSMVGSDMKPLVCHNCGFVQLFTNPADFRGASPT